MRFALTFDDGPGPSTRDLHEVLRAHGCAATFFVLGQNVTDCWWVGDSEESPTQVLVDAVKAGHVLGNHTISHNGRLGLKELVQEIRLCDELIQGIYREAGKTPPLNIPFRLPYGIRAYVAEYMEGGRPKHGVAMDPRITALASVGRGHVHWTSILPDWEATCERDVEKLYGLAIEHLESMERQGLDVVFAMHDGRQKEASEFSADRSCTVKVVDRLLREAKKRKWECWTVGA